MVKTWIYMKFVTESYFMWYMTNIILQFISGICIKVTTNEFIVMLDKLQPVSAFVYWMLFINEGIVCPKLSTTHFREGDSKN